MKGEPEGAATRQMALWEIVSVSVSLLLALWFVVPLSGGRGWLRIVPIGTAIALILLSHYVRGETVRHIGWTRAHFAASLKILWLPTLAMVALVLILGWYLGSLRFNRSNVSALIAWLPLWALMQQYVLQGYFNRRAQIVFGTGWRSIVLVGALFAVLHLPNPFLSIATFLCGLFWAYVYQRAPNLFTLAFAQAVSSFIASCALPTAWTNSLRVGIKYLG
jgi:membrane protease YdiL (CAAX protease family)